MKLSLFTVLLLLFIFSLGSLSQAQVPLLPEADYTSWNDQTPEKINITVGNNSFTLTKNDVQSWLNEETTLITKRPLRTEIENTEFCAYKKSIICTLMFSVKDDLFVKKQSTLTVNELSAKEYIADIARQVNKDPEDAKLKIDEGKVTVFSLSQKGIRLNEDESADILIGFIQGNPSAQNIELSYEELSPQLDTGSIDNLGITSLLGEGRSNFRGSPKNRIHNIKVATSRYNGTLLKPGEEFSFVKVLGPVDGEHGYLPELVIKKDKTEPEFGGGICQVSTTAFRAAIYSGLEITARKNHAYPVQYYNPQGMDSTIYIPRPDLKFVNNTPGHILIQTKIEGTELIFQFYGTDDGRKTTVIGPTITERHADGSMKATFTQQILDKDGNTLRNDVFNSSYDSPNKYPHPGAASDTLTKKPDDWSEREWKRYKKEHGL